MKKFIVMLAVFALTAAPAFAQTASPLYYQGPQGMYGPTYIPVSSTNPLPITVSGGAVQVSLGTSLTTANPSISGDLSTGFYTAGAAKVDLAISGVKLVEWTSGTESVIGNLQTSGQFTIVGATPTILIDNSSGGTDSKFWIMTASTTAFQAMTADDTGSGLVTWLNVPRTGTTVNNVSINTSVAIGTTAAPTVGAALDASTTSGAIVLPKGSDAQRPAATVGMIRYSQTANAFEGYSGSSPSWQSLGTGGSATTNIGTQLTGANPKLTSDAGTGLYTPAGSTVSIIGNGVEILRVDGTTTSQSTGIAFLSKVSGQGIFANIIGGGTNEPYSFVAKGTSFFRVESTSSTTTQPSTTPVVVMQQLDGTTNNLISLAMRNSSINSIVQLEGVNIGTNTGAFHLYTMNAGTLTNALTVNQAQNVGIGTATVRNTARLDVQGTTGITDPTVNSTPMGVFSNGSTANGEYAGYDFGYAGATAASARIAGTSIAATGTTIDFFTQGVTATLNRAMRIDAAGVVNIGTTTAVASTKLTVNGGISQTTVVSCTTGVQTNSAGLFSACVASDESLKKNIEPLSYDPNFIFDINPVTYMWKDIERDNGTLRIHSGFIAQQVQKVEPSAVVSAGKGLLGVDSNGLIAPTIMEVKEQRKRLDAIEMNKQMSTKTTFYQRIRWLLTGQ